MLLPPFQVDESGKKGKRGYNCECMTETVLQYPLISEFHLRASFFLGFHLNRVNGKSSRVKTRGRDGRNRGGEGNVVVFFFIDVYSISLCDLVVKHMTIGVEIAGRKELNIS